MTTGIMFLVGGAEMAPLAACPTTQGMPASTTIGLIAIATALQELPCSMNTLSWWMSFFTAATPFALSQA